MRMVAIGEGGRGGGSGFMLDKSLEVNTGPPATPLAAGLKQCQRSRQCAGGGTGCPQREGTLHG